MDTNNPRRLCFANIEEMERYYEEKARTKEEQALKGEDDAQAAKETPER